MLSDTWCKKQLVLNAIRIFVIFPQYNFVHYNGFNHSLVRQKLLLCMAMKYSRLQEQHFKVNINLSHPKQTFMMTP